VVNIFCNLVAKPSRLAGVPYPVINRAIFGVRGANIPAIVRGRIGFLGLSALGYICYAILPQPLPGQAPRLHSFPHDHAERDRADRLLLLGPDAQHSATSRGTAAPSRP